MTEIKTIDIQNDWEKRFDELFESLSRCGRTEKDFGKNTIRDFIRNLLADARKEERMKAEVETGLKNFKVIMKEIPKARKEGYEEGVMAMAQDCEERNKGMFRGLSEGVYIKTGKELLATTNKSDHIVPPDKMVDTQNDTKKEDVLLQVANMDRIVREKWFIDWLKNHDKAILADARKEVERKVEKMKKSYQKPLAEKVMERIYDCDVTAYNKSIDDVLATLKEERV